MTERPILFSGAMVRALLAGTKTQTRRVVKCRARGAPEFHGGAQDEDDPSAWGWFFDGPDHHGYEVLARGLAQHHDHGLISAPCPYGEPGDRLWVRETWGRGYEEPEAPTVMFAADGESRRIEFESCGVGSYLGAVCRGPAFTYKPERWKPSIHMPRWASRLTLEVTDVRVERLNDISETDATAEGLTRCGDGGWHSTDVDVATGNACFSDPVDAYAALWESINGADSWAANPWVWCMSFKRVTP
jgi:hypothetical protein